MEKCRICGREKENLGKIRLDKEIMNNIIISTSDICLSCFFSNYQMAKEKRKKQIEFIMEDLEWIENLDIPYKQDYLELAQDINSKECIELIGWYQSEKGEIELGKEK